MCSNSWVLRDLLNVQLMLWRDGFCFWSATPSEFWWKTVFSTKDETFGSGRHEQKPSNSSRQLLGAENCCCHHVGFKEGQTAQNAAGIFCGLHHGIGGCLLCQWSTVQSLLMSYPITVSTLKEMMPCVVIADMTNKCGNLNSHILSFTALIHLRWMDDCTYPIFLGLLGFTCLRSASKQQGVHLQSNRL